MGGISMTDSNPPFDVDRLTTLVKIHEDTESRNKQRDLERAIIDETVGRRYLTRESEEDEPEFVDSSSIEARRDALEKMG
jgi:hypothetical protein